MLADYRRGGFQALQARFRGKVPVKEESFESDEKQQPTISPPTPVSRRTRRDRSPDRQRIFSPRPKRPIPVPVYTSPQVPHALVPNRYPQKTYRPVIYDLSDWNQQARYSSRVPNLIPVAHDDLERAIRYGLVGGRVNRTWRGRSRNRKRKFNSI